MDSTFNKLWAELDRLLIQEVPAQPPRPEKDRVVFFQRLTTLYVRYIQIFRQLEEVYDQVVHPQKRPLIREVLDGVMGRMVELKHEMVEKEFSEYHYVDDVLQDLKLTPDAIEIPIPRYFISERSKEQQLSRKMLMDIFNMTKVKEKAKPTAQGMNLEEAIKIIQVAERARQGRLRARFMRDIQRNKMRQSNANTQDQHGVDTEAAAAVCIQKVWRGYTQRKRTKIYREQELIFLGMVMDPSRDLLCPAATTAQSNEASRRIKREEYERDYQNAIVAITNKLRNVEGSNMRETMKGQIRQWFFECRDATGSFPDYPDEEDGGSVLIFAEKTPQQLMEEIAAKEEEDANKEKMKEDKGKGGEEDEEAGLKMLPSAFLSDLEVKKKMYVDVWKNRSESKNFSQRHDSELIKEEKRKEIESEIRPEVDDLMRQELASLKLADDKEKSGMVKGKTKKKSEKKKKKSKGGKKKKKEKDPTADRTLKSLCRELVEQGLLKQADNVKLRDLLGDYSYRGTILRQNDIEPMPSLSDVRQVLSLYAVLPLGKRAIQPPLWPPDASGSQAVFQGMI